MSILDELKRRNVIRVTVAYVAVAWLLIQVAGELFPVYGISDAAIRVLVAVLGVGLIPVLVISWAFELTPDGLKRDAETRGDAPSSRASAKRFDRIIMAVLAVALAYFVFDEFVIEPPPSSDNSIAVLPFVNMSPDPDQAYFAEGMSEELLNLLARVPELQVTSRSSSFQFKGDALDLREVAASLNVAHILEGSVRKAGNDIRITVQLIEARSDKHLWSETYNRTLNDIFAIQDDVATQVVEQLRLQLLDETPTVRPVDPEAYTLMLAAREILHLQRVDQLEKAKALLQKALEIDPDYVDALVQMQNFYWTTRHWDQSGRHGELTRMMESIRIRVLELDPKNASILAVIAWELFESHRELKDAARLFEEALVAEPSNFYALRGAGVLAHRLGNKELYIPILEYLVERDPMTLFNYDNLGHAYLTAGRIDDARSQFEMVANLNDIDGEGSYGAGKASLLAGKPQEALNTFEPILDDWHRLLGMATALSDLGRIEESQAALQELRQLTNDDLARIPTEEQRRNAEGYLMRELARSYAWTGNADEAFHSLEIAAENDFYLIRIVFDPFFANLHDDPRWLALLHAEGISPEQLAEIKFNPKLPFDL